MIPSQHDKTECPRFWSTPSNKGIHAGVLIECDASIKAIISKIDADRHEIIIEDLDEMHLLVKEGKLEELKLKLADVRPSSILC